MSLISKLLRKNTSPARIAGFVVSNFIGLAIIVGGLQFYEDAGSLWTSDDSFIKTDYLVVNKRSHLPTPGVTLIPNSLKKRSPTCESSRG